MCQNLKEVLLEKGYCYVKSIWSSGTSQIHIVYSEQHKMEFVAKVILACKKNQFHPFICDTYENEMQALYNIYDYNIIKLFDNFVVDNCQFLILEFCPNGTLEEKLTKGQPLDDFDLIPLSLQISRAIAACHESLFSHNDIKPGNMIVDKYDRIILSDFGLARKHLNYDETNMIFNYTIAYAAPEILSNQPHCEFKSDIWSLGVTFYQMATGVIPFLSTDKFSAIELMKKGISSLPENINKDYSNLVLRCLSFNPEDRPLIQEIVKSLSELEKYTVKRGKLNKSLNKCTTRSFAHLSKDKMSKCRSVYRSYHNKYSFV